MTRVMLMMAVAMACLFSSVAQAGLDYGDPAPKLHVDHWLKGSPVDLEKMQGKGVVVVEFWATWCGPCIASIPHLTEVQKEYGPKGVTVIGLTSADPNNQLEKVKEFMEGKDGKKMGYTVAFEQNEKTFDAYMTAAGESGIPTAFIVDKKGRVAWIGHPMGGMDAALDSILAGTYDIAVEKQVRNLSNKLMQASWSGEHDTALKTADELIAVKPTMTMPWMIKFDILSGEKKDVEGAKQLAEKALKVFHEDAEALANFASSLASREDAGPFLKVAARAADRAAELDPKNTTVSAAKFHTLAALGRHDEALTWAKTSLKLMKDDARQLSMFARMLSTPKHADRCSDLALEAVELAIKAEPDQPAHLMTKFEIMALCKKDARGAEQIGRYLIEKSADNANLLNSFAWDLATNEEYNGKFSQLALAAAERCDEITKGENWMFIDTYAVALAGAGHLDKAIKMQAKAIELCGMDEGFTLDEMTNRLEDFKKTKAAIDAKKKG
jgi:thiol-disulfide isomerase/thioredoxin